MKSSALRLFVCALTFACAFLFAGCSTSSSSEASSVQSDSSASAEIATSEAVSSEGPISEAAASVEAASSDASATSQSTSTGAVALAPGEYTVDVDTHNSMFHVNEADEGKGVLTVDDQGMTVHFRLASKKITNLYVGTADQAANDSADILEPTTDKVTYSDGYEEEVYGFDVPVPALDEPFDVAILGEKGKWYDHQVIVSNPVEK